MRQIPLTHSSLRLKNYNTKKLEIWNCGSPIIDLFVQ